MQEAFFLPYQSKWLKDDSLVKIWEKSRRIGATYAQSYEDVRDCVDGKVKKVWFSSADESAGKEYIDECGKWASVFNVAAVLENEIIIDERNGVKSLMLQFDDGAQIHALTSNPKRFRSKGGKIVLDEFAFHEDPKALWKAAKPAATWGFPIRILSTHNGTASQFNQFVERINEGKLRWSHHKTDIYTAVEQGLLDKIRGRKTSAEERDKWISEQREDCFDEEAFLEEYCCIPVDGRSAFITYEMLSAVSDAHILWNGEPPARVLGDLYLGMDIGRRKDLSVIWVIEKIGPMRFTRMVKVMDRAAFRYQREVLYSLMEHPNMRRAAIDNTGIGMQLAEEAKDTFGQYRVEEVTFTGPMKEQMAYGLRTNIESKELIIPDDKVIREDFHSIKRIPGAGRNVRFAVEGDTDGHADRFWAAALAELAAKSYSGPVHVASRQRRASSRILQGHN